MNVYERLGTAVGRFSVAHRRLVIAASAVLFALFALGLPRARFSTDYRIYFSHEDPGLAAFERLERVFTKTDNVLFVVKSEDGLFTRDALAAVQELEAEGWKLPHASRVDAVTSFPHATAEGDDIAQRPLVSAPAASLDDATLATLRDVAMHEPMLVGSLVSKDGRTAGVNVTLRLPGKDPDEVVKVADAARRVVAEVSARHPRLAIRPSGMAFMNDAFMQASVRDMAVLVPAMLVVMLVAMAVLLRSARATAAVGLVLGASSAMAMAVAGWLGYPLTPSAVAAPMIVVTVAIADGVHVVLATMEAAREGRRREDAIVHAVSSNLEAVTYTWLTTIVGFVCLNYSEAPPVAHLANMTCIGVTLAFVLSFTLLPALLVAFAVEARPAPASSSLRLERALEALARFVMRRKGLVLAAGAALTVVLGMHASRLETNDEFVGYFDRSLPFRRDVDFTMQNLSGIYRLEYDVASGAPQGVTEPAYLATLDRFETFLRAQPEVEHVLALPDVMKRVHEVAQGSYALPSTREEAGEELLMHEMSLPPGLELTDRVSVDKAESRVTVTVKDLSTRDLTAFARRTEQWLRDNAPRPMWSQATGPVVIFSQLGDRNAKSMLRADLLSVALISLCMILVLRSLELGLLSVVPNLVPVVVGYGVWRLTVGQMNIVATVAGSISLGVIVDDTIHFLSKYQAARRKGLTPEEAMPKTLAHVGPAMLGTSVVLMAGFGVLTLSAFQMTSYLGWLSLLIVGVAPFADLVLAPALVSLRLRATPVPPASDPLPLETSNPSAAGVS